MAFGCLTLCVCRAHHYTRSPQSAAHYRPITLTLPTLRLSPALYFFLRPRDTQTFWLQFAPWRRVAKAATVAARLRRKKALHRSAFRRVARDLYAAKSAPKVSTLCVIRPERHLRIRGSVPKRAYYHQHRHRKTAPASSKRTQNGNDTPRTSIHLGTDWAPFLRNFFFGLYQG